MTIDDMLTIATQLYQDIARNILSGSSHSSAQGSISSFEFPDYLVAGHDGLGNGDLVFSVIALCLIYRFVGLRATLLAASLFVFSDISLHVVTWYAQAHHLSFPFLFYIGPITILILIFGQPNLAQSEIFCYYGLKIY